MAEKKDLTKEEREKLRKLFAEYDLAEQEETKAQAVVDRSGKLKSKKCEEILAAFGGGPFVRSGVSLKIVRREWKNKETGAVTKTSYYLRGPQEVEGIEV